MFLAVGLGGISGEALIIFLIPTIWGQKQGYTIHFALVLSQFSTYMSVKHRCVLKEGKGKGSFLCHIVLQRKTHLVQMWCFVALRFEYAKHFR